MGRIVTGPPISAKVRNGPRFAAVDAPVTFDAGSLDTIPLAGSNKSAKKSKGPFAPVTPAVPTTIYPPITRADLNSADARERCAGWVIERYAMRQRRERGEPQPLTSNTTLAAFYFCNVFREHDPVTCWVAANIIEPHRNDVDCWFAIAAGRLINEPKTLIEILPFLLPFDPVGMLAALQAREARGETIWRRAYRAAIAKQGEKRIPHLIENILKQMWANREALRWRPEDTLATFAHRLRQCDGMGPFLAAQVVADYKHTERLKEAPDWWTFALPGEGSEKGLNQIRGRPAKPPMAEAQWLGEHGALYAEITPLLAEKGVPRLDAQNLQNIECEFNKFERARLGDTKGLRRYKPAPKPKAKPKAKSKPAVEPQQEPPPPETIVEPVETPIAEPATVEAASNAPTAEAIPAHILEDVAQQDVARSQPSSNDAPDRSEAARFLALLDPAATQFTFQTFDDNKERGAKALARVLHGSLDQHFSTLTQLNEQGAGIYVTINETNLRGRRLATNVVRVRALFSDLDGAPLDPVLQAAPAPHLVTETSPRRWHCYWGVKDVALEAFTPCQKALAARFNGDAAVIDLPRVMRLPGFFNRKAQPFMARIVRVNDAPAYAVADFAFAGATAAAEANKAINPPSFNSDYPLNAWSFLNSLALANLDRWVPELFGDAAVYQPGTGGWRVSSVALGRDLEEDLSIHPSGIKDWGVHDLGDTRAGKRSPIDLVMEFQQLDLDDAFSWLNDRLHSGPSAANPDEQRDTEAEQNSAGATGASDSAKAETHAGANGGGADANAGGYSPAPWPTLEPAALHGLAGEIVATILPHTEADPVALLLHFLVYFGNAIGRSACFQHEESRHPGNLYAVIAGDTAKSRKGTAAARIRRIFEVAEPDWLKARTLSSVSSGEGIIHQVRDAATAMRKGNEVIVDLGVADKRLMLTLPEFSSVLTVMKREGFTTSAVLRDAWDAPPHLKNPTKNNPQVASDPHISAMAHITIEELQAKLDETSMANGFGNRILFACVQRSKDLPFGAALDRDTAQRLGAATRTAILAARALGAIERTASADALWAKIHPELSRGKSGLLGHITSRAEPQTMRLALLYALLDRVRAIDAVHLEAALAVWRYCEASARYIFGGLTGDPIADVILQTLLQRKPGGLSRSEISNLFSRNVNVGAISAALGLLERAGKVRCITQPSGGRGRPAEMWFAR